MNGVKSAYTTSDVARLLKLSNTCVVRQMDRGVIPHFKIPGSRFRRIGHRQLVGYLAGKPEHRFVRDLLKLAARSANGAEGKTARA